MREMRERSASSAASHHATEWASALTRRLEQALHVHPEKYQNGNAGHRRESRSARTSTTRHNTPAMDESGSLNNNTICPLAPSQQNCRSKSMDASIATLEMGDDPNGMLLRRGSTASRRTSPQRGTPASDEKGSEIVTVNVSGLRFQTFERTLQRYPNTLLGSRSRRQKYWNPDAKEYFFDRHRGAFESILYIYQSCGRIKRPEAVPIDVFLREMRYFQMGDEFVEEFWISEGYEKPAETPMPDNPMQRRIWELMEFPDSSLSARIVAFVSIIVIVISIVSFCWETVPSAVDPDAIINATEKGEDPVSDRYSNPFFWLEFVCIIWFSIELFLRFISCPSKRVFVTSFLNVIDFIAIAPFFVNLIWMMAGFGQNSTHRAENGPKGSSSMSFAVLRVLRLVRVFRIFKLSRHSVGLQILGKTFRASVQELCLLVFFMVIALVLFSSGIYFAEQGEPNTKFTSIPASFWFVLVTMTTVGYGDLVPTGSYGKIVGGMCALIGVLTLALPVPIIVANFKHFYRQENRLATMKVVGKECEDLENDEDDY
ncbi:hypothetical protein PMAYCL1PPCAC_05248 [Pristionchus mayeri]|uniref:BTB domain-containing protein n=1 Tax=Pristionchus mayeri TaxID=1317129 RepID=A0AAN4ZAM6_9BILA|nr:hypothetical protein PMAYCL1PPCAC_05248 [Pristionchus mayeri]